MIFILDRQENVVSILKNNGGASESPPFFDDLLTQDLATGAETFKFSTIGMRDITKNLIVGNYVALKHNDKYKMFQIMQTEERHEEVVYVEVYCECAGLELINKVFRKRKFISTTLKNFMSSVLDETGWNVGFVFDSGISIDIDVEDGSVYSILQNNISKFGGELEFRVELSNGRVSNKFIDIYHQRGEITGKRFEFGKDIEGITRKVDSSELKTALIGVGKDGLNFRDITIKGIDKPIGQDYVGDKEAFDRYNHNGYHIMGVFEFETKDAHELLRQTHKALQDLKKPKIEYTVDVALLWRLLDRKHDKIGIGDTVAIVDNAFTPPIHLMARVSKLETSFTDNQADQCTLSNFIEVKSNITSEMRKLASKLEGYVDGAISEQYPLDGDKIKDGAIKSTHIVKSSIKTDHLMAGSITADRIKAGSITANEIKTGIITANSALIEDGAITRAKIGDASIDNAKIDKLAVGTANIQDLAVGTAQIADASINNAKIGKLAVGEANIQNASITNAKIKDLHADKITAGDIDADRIKTNVINAINASIGKINADHIDVDSIRVENIDAGQITTGTLDADRITSSVISAINASIENATINSAKIGNLSADKITSGEISTDILKSNIINAINASIGKINADHIDVDSIKVGNIDAGQITTGDLDAERITATVISAINSYAGSMKIKQGQIEKLSVGSANIVDLDVSKLTGDKINANLIDVDKIKIKDANITGTITASKISGGTLDASNIKVTNLNADSITTGSLVVQGENLIPNATFGKTYIEQSSAKELAFFWRWDTKYFQPDETQDLDGAGVIKYSSQENLPRHTYAIGCDNINGFHTGYLAKKGDIFVASAYFKIPKNHNIDVSRWKPTLGIWYYKKMEDGTLSTVKNHTVAVDMNITNEWQRIELNLQAPEGTTYIKPVISGMGVGTFYFSQPMLSKGQLSSVWKPHTDELISDGAIDEDKIANESINSDKLNINELFVGDNAFIKSLKAVEIDASSITTGTISNDRIDISGLVGFESLDKELKPLFDVSGDKTYINGGMIATNTIKANAIDLLSGLTVRGEDNTTTFSIASNGQVEVNGLLRSGNFDEDKNMGYQLSTDGRAILNQAVVKGDVILPNAGITNYGATKGAENLLQATDYDMYLYEDIFNNTTNWQKPKEQKGYRAKYAHLNSKPQDEHIKDYHVLVCNFDIERDGLTQGYINPRGVGLNGHETTEYIELKPNTDYVFSGWIYVGGDSTGDCRINIWSYDNSGNNKTILSSGKLAETWKGYFEFVEFKFRTNSRKFYQPRIYLNRKNTLPTTGVVQFMFYNLKLEEGSAPTPYCPAIKDQFDYVRIWSGTNYHNRNNAPFRVTQKGDVFATNATVSGRMYGNYDNGRIHIHDNEIVIDSVDTRLNEEGVEVNLLARDTPSKNPYIKFSSTESKINTDLTLGTTTDKKVFFDNSDRALSLNNTSLRLISPTRRTGGGASVFFNPNGYYNSAFVIKNNVEGMDSEISMGYSAGETWNNTTIINHNGSKGGIHGDICFRRSDGQGDIEVNIAGDLKIKNKINSTTQNIEIRSVAREGWGFYAT